MRKALVSTAILSATISLGTALIADRYLSESIPLVGSVLSLHYHLNPGVAFGILLPQSVELPLILLALGLLIWVAHTSAHTRMSQVGFGLILGGGLANIVDRLIDGHVTDYVSVLEFPVFNAADSCITFGVVVLLLEMIEKGKETGTRRGVRRQESVTRRETSTRRQ